MSINREKYIKILDTLTDAMGQSEGQSVEEIKEELREEGVDVDTALARLKQAQQNISLAAKRSALDVAKGKRLSVAEKSYEIIGKFNDWTKEQIIERLMELSGPEAGLAYRDLDAMGKEEMASILEDLEIAHRRSITEEDDDGE